MLRRCLLLVFALSGFRVCTPIFSQDSAAPAPSASAADTQTKLRARDEVWQQAQALQSAGKAAEAITAGERVLALERELYGNTHAELTGTIEWLSQQYLAQQNLPQAETYAVELQRVQEALHGKAGWQSVSARWRLDYVRKLSKVEPATLTRMLGIEAEVNRLLAEGKQAEAAAEREKLIPLEEAALGSDYPFFANTFANQADCLLTAEQFAAAETAASRALSIRRKQLGDQHPDTAMAAFLLVRSLIGQDRHSEAVERLILARDAWLASGLLVDAAWMDSWRGDSLVVLKRYAAAKAAYEAALAVFREQKEAEGEAQQLTRLSNLADVYVDLAAWSEAESLREEILRLETARLGEQHWQVIDARLAVGHVRLLATLTDEQRREVKLGEHLNSEVLKKYAAGALSAAIPDAERICEIRKTILGDRHPDYATSLDNLGSLYLSMSDASKAEPLHVQALEIRKAVLGDRHPDYASSLNKLAGLYESMGVPGKAEPLYLQALEIRKAVLGERHPDYARVLNNLLGLYVSMSDFAKAAPLLVQLLEIQKAVLGDRHPDYARGLNNLAGLYKSLGDALKAERLFVQALEIRKSVLGDHHPDYAASLNNLAELYASMGDYAKAEPLYLQALEIVKAVLGDRHPYYAVSLNNLAQLYASMGDYAKAEPLYLQALEIQKAVLGDRHPDYATSLNNLAALYKSMDDAAKAEPLYVQALEIRKAVQGDGHPDYATGLNNLADLYCSMGDFAKAEPLFVQALEIIKAVLGDRHPFYTGNLNNLAVLYSSMGDYAKAESLYVQALEIQKSVLGDRHPNYANCLNNLAMLYESMGDGAKAEPLYLQALEISRDVLERAALVQSERQQLAMGQMLRYRLDSYVSFTLQSGQFQVSAAREVLRWKGATLVRQRAMRLAAEDPAIADRFRALQQVSRRLASLSRATPAGDLDNWKTQITDLTAEKERLEAQLSGDSSAFRSAMEEITPQQIQAAVPRDAVLIDYLQFTRSRPAEKKGKFDSTTSLLAVIVKHDGEPQLVELGPVAKLSSAIDTWRDKFGMSPQGQQAGLEIRRQIWEPLLPHIGDANTILVSVDGVLGRLPLGALPGKAAGTYLIEDHRLAMIPVPQLLPALVDDAAHTTTSQGLLLLGNVDYNSEAPQADGTATTERRKRPIGEYPGDLVDVEYETLPGAAEEVELIRKLYSEIPGNKATDIQLLKQTEASEAAFRVNAGKFRHIHVATHGFFAPARAQSAFSPEAINDAAERSSTILSPAAGVGPVPQITGIGARLEAVEEGAVVGQLHPDGPAARGGNLRAGDVIIGVGEGDGEILSLAGMPLPQIVERIRGLEGSTVRLRVQPSGSTKTQVVSIVRAAVPGAAVGAPATSSVAFPAEMLESQARGFNPDVLSGLALAGANLQPEPGKDDGILTAQEIAFLPLSGVDTAVLSVCETGLGSSAGGEGLISVQRAFQISGVRTTVASLWKVDDRVTQFLMERFYRNLWQKKMTRLDAMREAQLYLLKNPQQVSELLRSVKRAEDSQKFSDVSPFYWAAFTLSGDWR